VALIRAPENVGEKRDTSLEAPFALGLGGRLTFYFSGGFVGNLWFLPIVRVNVVSCRVTL